MLLELSHQATDVVFRPVHGTKRVDDLIPAQKRMERVDYTG